MRILPETPKPLSGVKYILLDIDDTVLDFERCSNAAVLSAAEELNVDLPDGLLLDFHRINRGLWRDVELGKLTAAGLHEIRWNLIFRETGIDFDGILFEKYFRKYLDMSAYPVEGAGDFLAYLSKKYVIAGASNASLHQQINRLSIAGFIECFKYLFVSESIGADKPSAAFFDHCMEKLGTNDLSEVIMIGDSLTADINGACDYGLRTVWFNKKRLPVPPECKADHVIEKLSEIDRVL